MTAKRAYVPRVERLEDDPVRYAQTILADQLVLEDEGEVYLLGFAEGLVHGLLITLPPEGGNELDFGVEFNDQGNSAGVGEVAGFILRRDSLTVLLGREADLCANRISYQESADEFSGPKYFSEYPLGAIIARFAASDEQWAILRDELGRATRFGVRVEVHAE